MKSKKEYDVFLSHNSVDKPWAIKLKKALEDLGIMVWLDQDEIRPGDIFAEALEKGISQSKSVALIVSPESMHSGWVKNEYYRALSLAINKELRLIPVLLREAEVPGFLKDRNWVDFRDETIFEESLKHLVWGITGEKQIHTQKSSFVNQYPYIPVVNIWIVEFEKLVIEGLKLVLESNEKVKVVGESASINQLLEISHTHEPHIVILSASILNNEYSGKEIINKLKEEKPRIKVLALTTDEFEIKEAKEAGADEAIRIPYKREELLNLIQGIMNDDKALCTYYAQVLENIEIGSSWSSIYKDTILNILQLVFWPSFPFKKSSQDFVSGSLCEICLFQNRLNNTFWNNFRTRHNASLIAFLISNSKGNQEAQIKYFASYLLNKKMDFGVYVSRNPLFLDWLKNLIKTKTFQNITILNLSDLDIRSFLAVRAAGADPVEHFQVLYEEKLRSKIREIES